MYICNPLFFMKETFIYRRSVIVTSVLIISVFSLVMCMNNEKKTKVVKNEAGEEYAGSAVCTNCHKDIYDSHIHTAHYLTSKPASAEYIKGNFEPGRNRYAFN